MGSSRRTFLKNAGLGLAATGMATSHHEVGSPTNQTTDPCDDLPKQGPKPVVRGKQAVCSSSHPIVTQTMLDVLKAGGKAADAAVAGSLVQATVELHMTNHTGTVTFLYWEAKTGKAHQLDSGGTIVPDLPPFRPVPGEVGGYAAGNPMACIPGFMPGMAAIHERFGTLPWARLCEPAIRWAEGGHVVSSFEHALYLWQIDFHTYFPAGRELFTPNGFIPQVGERHQNPKLAETLKRLAREGPEYFTRGEWARHFVEEANRLGWPIKMAHMTANPPRWMEPLRYPHRAYEILQLAPPQRTGVYSAIVLGILRELDVTSLGHYTESPEALYYFAHALRHASYETGLLNDPLIFEVPVDTWTSPAFHQTRADIFRRSKPKVDLTPHVRITSSKAALAAAGLRLEERPPAGSCELSIVDSDGNWVQMMNTLQTGGIPGAVVDGVPMVGSHVGLNSLSRSMSAWLVPGSRVRSVMGNTIVLKEGKPCLSLGSPGNVHCTVPQMLSSILDFGLDPYEASVLPRMLELRDDNVLAIESRLADRVVAGLAKLGMHMKALPVYDFHMGSYQMCWRDPKTGLLSSSTDPRRVGMAAGL